MASVLARQSLALALVVAAVSVTAGAAGSSKSFNITNSCVHTVWPEISSAAPNTTVFELAPGQWEVVPVPSEWSGRVWGRTFCSSSTAGKYTCVTGGPVTLAEFTLDGGGGGVDLYDVSLVHGFNLPVMVAPQQGGAEDPAPAGGNKNCAPTGCVVDMKNGGGGACPPELRVITSGTGGAVGCMSACQAFGSPKYCCTGEYGTPDTCYPSAYSELFKKACPLAVSYAYDDGADSIFTCGGGDITYTITFCPGTTSGKLSSSPDAQPPSSGPGNLQHLDGTTPTPNSTGGSQVGAATPPWRIVLAVAVLGLVTAALGALVQFWALFKLCCNRAAAGAAV